MVVNVHVHRLITDVLNVALRKSERNPSQREQLYVGQFFTRISNLSFTEDITLGDEDIDNVIRATVFACILHNRSPFTALAESYSRCLQATARVDAGVKPFDYFKTMADGKLAKDDKTGLTVLLSCIKHFIISNTTLLIVCPMFFNIEDLVSKQDLKRPLFDILNQSVRYKGVAEVVLKRGCGHFVHDLVIQMWDNDNEVTKDELRGVLDHIRSNVVLTPIGNKPITELHALNNIATSKIGAHILLDWMKECDVGNVLWRASGVKREIDSLFGRIFTSLPMIEELLEAAKLLGSKRHIYEEARSARRNNFYGKRDLASLKMAFTTLREDHHSYIEQVAAFIKSILRVDAESRESMLVMIGQLVSANTSKRHMSRLTHVEQPPITLDDNFRRRILFIPDSTYGTSLNIMWVLLILAAGITEQKVETINANFCQLGFYIKHKHANDIAKENEVSRKMNEMRKAVDAMLGFLSTNNTGMGDEREMVEALDKQNIDIVATYNEKFITQIFWITLHGLGMLYQPSLQEFLKLIVFTLQTAQTSPDPMNDQGLLEIFSHLFTWKCVIQHPKFVEALWHYINISLVFFIRCAFSTKLTEVEAQHQPKLQGRALCVKVADMYASGVLTFDNGEMTPNFAVLPVDFIEIILDIVKNVTMMRYYVDHLKPEDFNVLEFMDFDLLISTCIYIIKAPQKVIKNITLKCDTVSSIILNLTKANGIEDFARSNVAKRNLIDALTNAFIVSQKADYNSRVTCRLNIIQALAKLFEVNAYKKSFVTNIIANKENFVQFMHLILSDTSFIFEEVVTFLSEIRRRELSGNFDEPSAPTQLLDSSRSSQTQHQGEQEAEPVDPSLQEGAIDANQLKNMPFKELKGRTRTLVEYGSEIITLLHILCREFHQEITSMAVLLPQVASCLGCCLQSLAGGQSSNLKVKNMAQYNFHPKQWLSHVVKCYLALYGGEIHEHSEPLMKAIVSEGRYFKPANFEKAFSIVTREMLLSSKDRREFFNMSQKLCQYAKATNTLYQSAMEAEIPDEFMDPIMMDIMEDPVLLPTSGIIMDRKNIERHLMSEATDPFSRQPLTKAQLVPQPELKNSIDEFLASLSLKKDNTDDIYQS